MDDEEDNDNTTRHYNVTADDVEVSGELESGDNSTSDHAEVVDPDQLIGPQVIDMIMNKPEFSFLIRYYSLLYQSLIPNCKLTINTLRQHISISDNIEQYIVGAASRRNSCQRLINFLLTRLDSEKDYMQFCYHLKIISVMTDLPYKLITEFCGNDNWECNVPNHRQPSVHRSHTLPDIGSVDANIEAFSALSSAHQLNNCLVDNSTLECFTNDGASDDRAVKCYISNHHRHNGRRRLVVVEATATNNQSSNDLHKYDTSQFPVTTGSDIITLDVSFLLCSSEWRALEHFHSLCNTLPCHHHLIIDKLKTVPQLIKDEGEQLSKLITSSSTDVTKINEKIITYLILKLCYSGSGNSLVRLCDVMDELIDPTETPICVQQIRHGLATTIVSKSSSTVMVNGSSQGQQNILVVSQPSSLASIVSDTHTTTSPVTTLSVVECLTTRSSVTTSSSVVASISGQHVSTITTTAVAALPQNIANEHQVPATLFADKDFAELRAHYHNILHSMPDDYELTVGKLQNYISFDQICLVLSSSHSTIANQLILDYLIERISRREELLDLCDQLESIVTSHDMNIVINDIRLGVQQSVQFPISQAVTTNTQSLLSSDQQHHSVSHINDITTQMTNPYSKDVIKSNMQEKISYEERRLQKGFKYLQPPPVPSNHVHRQLFLDEIATKLLQAATDPNKYETTLTITGAGGFGKTTTVTSLCHYPVVNKHFTDGFVFIELGPQATDPSIKLSQLYHLLTGENLKHCDINHAEQEIKQITCQYYCNLLVIIDDVWHVEDAEPLVKAFSNCKTILTTRMNDIERYIPSKQSVTIGPMTQHEAITLLTSGVVYNNQLSQEDMSLLNELAQDVHLWPLLLSLIRGQLFHSMKKYRMSYRNAICNVQAKLHLKGLTAFDKNNIEAISKYRKLAVKACIELTLELLTKLFSDKIKELIIWTGIGTPLQTSMLENVWNISKQKAEETVEVLLSHGLIQITDMAISSNITQHCVEVHAVISQYIIENMDCNEVFDLSPFGKRLDNADSVKQRILQTFQHSYGINNTSSLDARDLLKYKLCEIQDLAIPFYFKAINIYAVTDPYCVMQMLEGVEDFLKDSPLLSLVSDEISKLFVKCREVIKGAHKMCRKLNQNVNKFFHERRFDEIIRSIENFIKTYHMCQVAQEAVNMTKIIVGCYINDDMKKMFEHFHIRTHDYHDIITLLLPHITLYLNLHKDITDLLQNELQDIEIPSRSMLDKFNENWELVYNNYRIKLQDVAPDYIKDTEECMLHYIHYLHF